MRVLFYAINGTGVGHVVRLLAIARQIAILAPDTEILFLTSSEADSIIYQEGFCAVKIPSKSLGEASGMEKHAYLKMTQSVAYSTISSYSPDILVVDTAVAGATDELLPVLGWGQKNVFIYREQRSDSPDSELLRNVLPLYDLIICPDTGESLDHVIAGSVRNVAVGPITIREDWELLSRTSARECLGLDSERKYVLVTLGGGGMRDELLVLDHALKAASQFCDLELVAALGPLTKYTDLPNHSVRRISVFPLVKFMRAFDASISSAGYNSFHEHILSGVPTVFCSMPRVLDDQDRRARTATSAGCIYCPDPSPALLASGLQTCLDRSCSNSSGVAARFGGARYAAECILLV